MLKQKGTSPQKAARKFSVLMSVICENSEKSREGHSCLRQLQAMRFMALWRGWHQLPSSLIHLQLQGTRDALTAGAGSPADRKRRDKVAPASTHRRRLSSSWVSRFTVS